MAKALYIITGASRGMGEAIARQLLAPENRVIGISRGQSSALTTLALERGTVLEQWPHDLAQQPLAAAQALQAWLQAQSGDAFSSATLINNAGMLAQPGPVDEASLEELSAVIRVGLEACLLMSSAFLRGTARLGGRPRRILNISSGLGRRAMAGSAAYSAAKAGMDNLSRAMALDEAEKPFGATVVSLAPGIVDTDMQRQLRAADPARFPDRAVFVNFKATGQLMSTDEAATKVLRYLARDDFGRDVIGDVRDA